MVYVGKVDLMAATQQETHCLHQRTIYITRHTYVRMMVVICIYPPVALCNKNACYLLRAYLFWLTINPQIIAELSKTNLTTPLHEDGREQVRSDSRELTAMGIFT